MFCLACFKFRLGQYKRFLADSSTDGSKTHMGSTMRLGSRRTLLHSPDCLTAKLYHRSDYVDERHKYIYKVNPDMVSILENSELKFVGNGETGNRMETIPFMWGLSSIQNSNRALEDPHLYF
ncbi:hypothetical protein ACS0TY_006187 [Phlomoides rotata]